MPGRVVFVFSVLSLSLLVSGCASTGELDSGPRYPEALQRSQTLNIHAFRSGTDLRLTNTTGWSFGSGMLWLNGRYGMEIDGLAVGQTLVVPLTSFVDEQGRRFGAGGFFAAERPELLALVEMTTIQARLDGEGERPVKFGLIAVGQRR
ncbi:MAG: hypothetical protein HRU13_10635 [Phycisphaerales bacterium]|nr:hypothetical protein [Phycisphaerales bacterium]